MIKCKKCRKNLIRFDKIVNSHGDQPTSFNQSCNVDNWYVKDDFLDSVPWIKTQIDSSGWTKGKFICPHKCGARLGSFNFIEGLRCNCTKFIVPSAHFIKKRVDWDKNYFAKFHPDRLN